MIKAILVSAAAFSVCIGFFAFSEWGLDLSSWSIESRALAYVVTVTLTIGSGAVVYSSDKEGSGNE